MTKFDYYEELLLDFRYLLKTQPQMFTSEDYQSLEDLLISLPLSTEQLANKLLQWCEEHPNILEAMNGLPTTNSDPDRTGLDGQKLSLDPKDLKDDILNEIRQGSSSQYPSQTPSKDDSKPPKSGTS